MTTGFLSGFGPSAGFAYFLTLGMVATVNPCGFAMLPAYLSYFLGLGGASSGAKADAGTEETGESAVVTRANPVQALRVALTISAGFMLVFAVAGTAVKHTSLPIYQYSPWVSVVIGVVLMGLGVAMVRGFELVIKLPGLNRGGRDRTAGSMFVFGVSYGIASIGCTLPIFFGAVVGTMNRDSFGDGLIAFLTYGAGMAVVLSALTVALSLARTSLVTALRAARRHVNRVAGVLVSLAGAYVTYYGVLELRTYRADSPDAIPSSSITDRAYKWQSAVEDWISRAGAVPLAVVLVAAVAVAVGLQVRRRRSVEQPSGARITR